jgi:superfamily II DNA or RNA helicase
MLRIPAEDPTKVYIEEEMTSAMLESVRGSLTYTDKSAVFQYQKFRKSHWFIRQYGQEAFDERLKELKKAQAVSLLFQDEGGKYWTRSGLAQYLKEKLNTSLVSEVKYTEPQLLPWDKTPLFEMHSYQKEALEKLLTARHAGVQIGTGLGKTEILTNIVKKLGLKTVVMAPSSSIAEQIHSLFLNRFGRKNVGQFFGGKKESKKLIVVATAQSLTRVEEKTEDWKNLVKTQVFVADESHLCPAVTLAKVCFGVLTSAPYRFFFSATQMRNDGRDLLLDAITGPVVYEMTVRDGVDKGYLAKPVFRMFVTKPCDEYFNEDANDMTRHHLFYNPKVTAKIGQLVNLAFRQKMPVLVLVDEVEQFTQLLPHLTCGPVGFAHGALNEGNRDKVPREYWDSDPNKLVAEFNAGTLPILVGTSCISTGTDVKAVKFLVYWKGGKSEIEVKQGIGRGTRLVPGKRFCNVIDFLVEAPVVGRHGEYRMKIYDDLYGPVEETQF